MDEFPALSKFATVATFRRTAATGAVPTGIGASRVAAREPPAAIPNELRTSATAIEALECATAAGWLASSQPILAGMETVSCADLAPLRG